MSPLDTARGDARREAIYTFVREHIFRHGFAPTVREIVDGPGPNSPGAVQRYLADLVAAGRLRQPRPVVFALPEAEWRQIIDLALAAHDCPSCNPR